MSRLNHLKSKWLSLTIESLRINDGVANRWFSTLESYYTPTPVRCYHNFNHIDELLTLHDRYAPVLKTPNICQLAIWFHDVVYDPTKHDNEDKSIEMFKSFAEESHLDGVTVDRVSEYIDATKHHTKIPTTNTDQDYFLDMDISILGREPNVYLEYSKNIRKEYIHVPEQQYRVGRSLILEKFKELGESLYKTNEFKRLYAKNAVDNLQSEIDRLSDESQPI
ncbi:predicted HD phosphohydrolase family protein [Heterostelium album PN500]|uniref:Predicted HD phosphohydrolase family protein n=1 Tax=Heterostelium pallidum (strain ATCC 26659 / Pp 5 / PN500) TaxID=670386 RepID=D3BSR2_HETP5|nr:predicted HD phosphohydrolase family protein [Heterostelium album PN500]EFA75527.1 predicted HD phosphohydrolase family protein [Heterostelium album PN500]|eukprot:XP_020427661.1 predicted HD phosphohydrolase family protein [Heterostelium album PN500]